MAKNPTPHEQDEQDYFYQAQSVASTGHLTLPVQKTMELQASVALPMDGGVGHSKSGPFSFEGVYRFEFAHSQVSGKSSHHKKSFNTLAQTVIEDLNIHEMVTADRVVSRVAVHHGHGERDSYITPLGSTIENLRIGGYRIEPVLVADWFSEHGTWESFCQHHGELAEHQTFSTKTEEGEERPRLFHCTMVKDWGRLPQGIVPHRHGLWVPEFGMVYIGEIFISRGSRRVRMVRTKFGCGTEGGSGSGMSGGGGGPIGT
jgi:hypothetical protein